ENNNSASPILCPDGSNMFLDEISFHKFSIRFSCVESLELTFRIVFNLREVNGKKGSLNVAKADAICKATYIMVWVRASSTFITFHGSSSAKYLLPNLAKFINSCCASLKR